MPPTDHYRKAVSWLTRPTGTAGSGSSGTPCWGSNSSAGLQVVDYGLWAIQRHVLSGGIKSGHYNRFVQPKMADDVWYPWGTVEI